jgi:L-aminopeptidase/D-esterase-like protein
MTNVTPASRSGAPYDFGHVETKTPPHRQAALSRRDKGRRLVGERMDTLFTAVTQATEGAVDNALVAARTMTGPNY